MECFLKRYLLKRQKSFQNSLNYRKLVLERTKMICITPSFFKDLGTQRIGYWYRVPDRPVEVKWRDCQSSLSWLKERIWEKGEGATFHMLLYSSVFKPRFTPFPQNSLNAHFYQGLLKDITMCSPQGWVYYQLSESYWVSYC